MRFALSPSLRKNQELQDLFTFLNVFLSFVSYAVFKVQMMLHEEAGGLKWTRTTDLTLIRRTL